MKIDFHTHILPGIDDGSNVSFSKPPQTYDGFAWWVVALMGMFTVIYGVTIYKRKNDYSPTNIF